MPNDFTAGDRVANPRFGAGTVRGTADGSISVEWDRDPGVVVQMLPTALSIATGRAAKPPTADGGPAPFNRALVTDGRPGTDPRDHTRYFTDPADIPPLKAAPIGSPKPIKKPTEEA